MFKKYSSIENTYREEIIGRIWGHGFGGEEFVVQEKVHGANLSYWTTDGREFRAAKRTEALVSGERFYNYDTILEQLRPKLAAIWETLKAERPEMSQMTVFGEVCGGNYPHPDVPRNNKAQGVQPGIYYSPDNHFLAFDIQINREEFLTVDAANALFEREGMFHAKTLFRGSLNDCLGYPNDFESTIPAELGLPELKPNMAEGVVIRSQKSLRFNNGNRVMLKNKNEKWSENKRAHKSVKPEMELSEKVVVLQEAIAGYVTENRLSNVLSKVGPITPKDFGKVIGLFNKDVVEDFTKDHGEALAELDKKEIKAINKSIGGLTPPMVRARLIQP